MIVISSFPGPITARLLLWIAIEPAQVQLPAGTSHRIPILGEVDGSLDVGLLAGGGVDHIAGFLCHMRILFCGVGKRWLEDFRDDRSSPGMHSRCRKPPYSIRAAHIIVFLRVLLSSSTLLIQVLPSGGRSESCSGSWSPNNPAAPLQLCEEECPARGGDAAILHNDIISFCWVEQRSMRASFHGERRLERVAQPNLRLRLTYGYLNTTGR